MGPENIWTTCFEDESGPDLKLDNMKNLAEMGCRVLMNVDAEKFDKDERFEGKLFSRVIFMFPHIGGKMKINRNRDLILSFLKSCKYVLAENAEVVVTLAKGQGGTPFEKVKRNAPDTWKIVEIAHEADFVLSQVYHLPLEEFSLYSQVGYRSQQKGFNIQDSVVHVLKLAKSPNLLPLTSSSNNVSVIDNRRRHLGSVPLSLFPPSYVHHLSFWMHEELTKEEVGKVVTLASNDIVKKWEIIDQFIDEQGKRSMTLELEYQSNTYALGPTKAFHFHYHVLGRSLANVYKVELR